MIEFYKLGDQGARHQADICDRSLNLLAHCQFALLDIGSECGGHGICGRDRIQIPHEEISHYSAATEADELNFSPAELAKGWRLACQTFPNQSDLTLHVGCLKLKKEEE
jgi:Na+-transporting NADH:ubiquinone oxidoreductase subunit NqrF